MDPIHLQVLEMARTLAHDDWTFDLSAVVEALPHLNARTVRTHIASRCCANAPSNHQSRYRYFRSVRRGVYRLEPAYRRGRLRHGRRARSSQEIILDSIASGVDLTLIADSLAMTPTDRLETMRKAVLSLGGIHVL